MTVEEPIVEINQEIPSIRKRKIILEQNIKKTHANEKPALISSQTGKTWGRARDVGILYQLTAFVIMAFCPLMVIYFWLSCTHYNCSLSAPILEQIEVFELADDMYKRNIVDHVKAYVLAYFPKPTVEGFQLYFGWVLFQGLLYRFLPGKIGYGQTTPAGHKLPYIVNGTLAWVLSHAMFIFGSLYFDLFPATIIYDNWGGLLVAANVYGYALSLFAYIKACIAPSHADDRKFSGSFVYDLFWGVEFNPRFGKYFDFKLFHNGRPGILAWTMINFSFACAQYATLGKVTNSMILLNWFHFLYVIDFFLNEDWYLRTIDIAHDHFGFYLGWGDSVWLPFMYTLQSHYLVRNPVELSPAFFGLVFFIGHFGYYIFRSTNAQKDMLRKTNGKCYIWGKPAKFIKTEYETSDGKVHNSLLLTSGFWGLSRHFNYLGDLFISLSMCLTCGFDHLLPYFYIIYMSILLLTRIHRDQGRCQEKYGKYWDEYCKIVPYKLIPYVF